MNEAFGEDKQPNWGIIAGVMAGLFLLWRLRKRRKRKKLLKARAKLEKKRREQGKKTRKKPEKKLKKKEKKVKKERSLVSQLVRFAVFQIAKKAISEQIKNVEMDLGKGKIGAKVVSSVES
jgi:LPXTG-motif cell wall-anchored protein